MTRKTYRTAQGKTLDIGALMLQHENVRAVGNMSVNAKGDVIDADNRPIDTKNQQVNRQYRKQLTNVQDTPVQSASNDPDAAVVQQGVVKKPKTTKGPTATAKKSQPTGSGLAAAIARARQISTTESSTPNTISKI